VADRQFGARVDEALLRPPFSRARHEDHARAVSNGDEAVLGVRRTVDEVPRFERPLLALDQRQALARKYEEVLLVGLTVIPGRLSGLEHGDGVADVGEGSVVALDDEGGSKRLVRQPCPVPDVDDEPAVGNGREAGLLLLEPRFLDHLNSFR
jgi:hypothetical protein